MVTWVCFVFWVKNYTSETVRHPHSYSKDNMDFKDILRDDDCWEDCTRSLESMIFVCKNGISFYNWYCYINHVHVCIFL